MSEPRDTREKLVAMDRLAEAISHVCETTGVRVMLQIVPRDWTDEQATRLARCINRVLEAGEPGIKTVEDVLHG